MDDTQLVDIRDGKTGQVLLKGVLDHRAPRGVRGWIERDLNIHPQAYSLREEARGVFFVDFRDALAAMLVIRDADSLARYMPTDVRVRAVPSGVSSSVARLLSLRVQDLWTELAMALAAMAPRITGALSTHLRYKEEDEDEDVRDDTPALGIFKFSGEATMKSSEKVLVEISVETMEDSVLVGARLDLAPDPARKPVHSVPFAAVWHKGPRAWGQSQTPDKQDMFVASTDSVDDASVLTWLVTCKTPLKGRVTFQGSTLGCMWRTADEPLVSEDALLHFVRAQDLLFWFA